MRQLIEDLISAMEYHVEQTRPIHSTTVALQAAKDALKAMPTHLACDCNQGQVCGICDPITPPAQPAVQEPVVFFRCNGCGHAYEQVHPTSCDCMEAGGFERVEYYTTPPAPAVPDAITDNSESPEYRTGWNDCRAEMLKGMKP